MNPTYWVRAGGADLRCPCLLSPESEDEISGCFKSARAPLLGIPGGRYSDCELGTRRAASRVHNADCTFEPAISNKGGRERPFNGVARIPRLGGPHLGGLGQHPKEMNSAGTGESTFSKYMADQIVRGGNQPMSVRHEHQAGWLTFRLDNQRRRLAPIPAGWASADDATIRSYLDSAQVMSDSTRPQ